ncbi:MAG TPA: caspase family protein [Gemmatimonadaceae bacterium]|nr:caspase family protein [Gemmatimonadaceae bacterium]
MAADDYAIVVGISEYPGLDDLDGPENDARAFYAWLIKPDGGAVEPSRVSRILSSDFGPPFASVTEAKPTMERVHDELRRFVTIAKRRTKDGLGFNVGRRLYLYLSGHGFARDLDEAAVFMADAAPPDWVAHIPGRYCANWFIKSGFFQEVVLLMDCCRENYASVPTIVPPLGPRTGQGVSEARYFFGFSSRFGLLSRERPFDGEVRGVFTEALLEGLDGGASTAAGEITAASLDSYLSDNMKHYLAPADIDDPTVTKQPRVEYDTASGAQFVLARKPPKRYRVTVHFPPSMAGREARVVGGEEESMTVADGAPWTIDRPRGAYFVVVAGFPSRPFEVTATGDVNVHL